MPINSLKALAPDEFDFAKAQHLLNRAGFGGTPGQVRALATMGLHDAVDYLLEFDELPALADDGSRFDPDIMRPLSADERATRNRAARDGDEVTLERFRRERQERQRRDRRQIVEMQQWWLKRMIESGRPFEEKMTLFWHGHFATGYRTIEDSYHMLMQNRLYRRFAAGNFADLVFHVIRDPAMLEYLDNDQNNRGRPNENLARELMELFVLGEGNEYTEADIKEGARALTGYTFYDDEFIFRANNHDEGEKRILGRRGTFNGDDFARIILARRAASEFLCLKLYRYFVNDLPEGPDRRVQGFVQKLAKQLRDKDYDLKPVFRTLFRSAHFYDEANVAAQIKSPVQLVVQAVRSLRTPPSRSLGALASGCDLMGQNLFMPPSVKGWAGGRSWINTSTLFVRQNVMIYLLHGRRPDVYEWEQDEADYDPAPLVEHLEWAGADSSAREAVLYLLRVCFGNEPHPDRVNTLTSFVERHGGRINRQVLTGLLALITAMPEYQLC